ncbi:unnamed protein product, partial [Brachionus calyciflorus]
MQSLRNKRRIEFDSPESRPLIKRNLSIQMEDSPVLVQPKNLFTYFDESSCDSGFDQTNEEHFSDEENSQINNLLEESFKLELNDSFQSDSDSFSSSKDSDIERVLEEPSEERLIGDMSRSHTLPILTKSRHIDLASIEPETLVDLINGKYNDKIGKYLIIDARYPYEFN